jgi:hypothetical protein
VNDSAVFSDARTFGSTGHNATFNGEQFSGIATNLNFQRNANVYSFGIQYLDRSPAFQAQDGFVPSNDTRMLFLNQSLSFHPTGAVVDQWSISMNNGLHFNYDDIRKETWALPNLYVQLKAQTSVNLTYFLVNDELFRGVQFDGIHRGEISIFSRPSSFLTLSFDGSFGKFIRRSDTPEMGTGHNIYLSAQVKPTSQLEVDLSYSRARLSSVATDALFYDGYIARSTGIFQFSKELFLRVIGQYNEFSRGIDIYPLVSYKLSPYTIFYLGSTYTMFDFGEPFGVQETATQYFVKLQYLIRA